MNIVIFTSNLLNIISIYLNPNYDIQYYCIGSKIKWFIGVDLKRGYTTARDKVVKVKIVICRLNNGLFVHRTLRSFFIPIKLIYSIVLFDQFLIKSFGPSLMDQAATIYQFESDDILNELKLKALFARALAHQNY